MLHESVLRTLDLPPADRFEAWTERLGRTHAPMRLLSDRADDYRGVQRLIGLGEVTIWPATFDHLIFRRTPRMVRQSDPELYHLSLLLCGEGASEWGEGQATYRVKDFHVGHSSREFEVSTGPDPVTIVGVEIPRAAVVLPGRRVEDRVFGCVDGRSGLGGLLTQFLIQLADDTSPYRPTDAARLGTIVVDLVTALFAHLLDVERAMTPETRARALALRIKEFVRHNLSDPDLSPTAIAAAHHISRSYLYRLFQEEGLTVSAYLREQRLKNAHRDLTDPALCDLPIHVIAARWGFPRAAEFTRAFRAAYGDTPSEVRAGAGRREPAPAETP